MKVSDFLQHGAENAISAAALCSIAGTTPRGLRHAIALERAAGGRNSLYARRAWRVFPAEP